MRTRRTVMAVAATVSLIAAGTSAAGAAPAADAGQQDTEYTVLLEEPGNREFAIDAVRAAGGEVVRDNKAVGLLTVKAPANGFVEKVSRFERHRRRRAVQADRALSRARTRPRSPRPSGTRWRRRTSRVPRPAAKKAPADTVDAGMDPLDGSCGASPRYARTWPGPTGGRQGGQRRRDRHRRRRHAPGHRAELQPGAVPQLHPTSRTIRGEVDGPCEFAAASTPRTTTTAATARTWPARSPRRQRVRRLRGRAEVSLVNIRAGQDSGYFFLQPTVDALTYAGDAGIDVVNMSFFVDPWLYNCQNNPADTPEQQASSARSSGDDPGAEVRAPARRHAGGGLGNQHTDLGNPQPDTISPDYPAGTAHPRRSTTPPAVAADRGTARDRRLRARPGLGKADYSNYGVEQISVVGARRVVP